MHLRKCPLLAKFLHMWGQWVYFCPPPTCRWVNVLLPQTCGERQGKILSIQTQEITQLGKILNGGRA